MIQPVNMTNNFAHLRRDENIDFDHNKWASKFEDKFTKALTSVQCQLDILCEEQYSERIKVQRLEKNTLGKWEGLLTFMESKNKELKRENKNFRKKMERPKNRQVVRKGKEIGREVLETNFDRVIADCYWLMIEDEFPRDEDKLMRRIEQAEREIKKVQIVICRYIDQVGRINKDFSG
ncbi:hypothetical protein KP509_25G019100 [Ceratopteris richardii]|uniref:Uncharacterized protein n=1 Tax=Ceratopteris richardii TaxID=49495 RepID=A0A8T2RQ53_CERRI|nr:hypothetical protein KP509_25G019100 [Ceratopteris richardii]